MGVSMGVSALVYPFVLRFSRAHNFVDNPNARKLQRIPIPVMGGLVVYAGIIAGGLLLSIFMKSNIMVYGMIGMTIMLVIGMLDDIKDLPARLRFVIEILLVWAFMWETGVYLDSLHGLWGVYELPVWAAVLLSTMTGVGLMNAINMIDGVDGYSSGYGMFACGLFALAFWSVWSVMMVCMALMVIGALLPFFLHNVFGVRSKMFIGDGGTLMLGMILTVFMFFAMSSKTNCASLEERNFCQVAFLWAVLALPVCDELRVMSVRVLRGKSPFSADKTHLHHLFIDMGFSHLGAAACILLMNAMIVLAWWLSWILGASIDVQMYVSLTLSVLATFVFSKVMKNQQNGGPLDEDGYPQGTWLWHLFCRLGAWSHREKGRTWRLLRYIADRPLMIWPPR